MSLLIFDLDGTLVDSLDDIHNALKKATDHFNIPTQDKDTVQKYVGPGIDELLTRALRDTTVQLETFRPIFRNYYRETHVYTTLYTGILDLLQYLKNRHHSLCVLTNIPEEPAKKLLKEFNIDHHFDLIIGPDTYGFYKPHPGSIFKILSHYPTPPEKVIMIGDGDADVLVAKAANIDSIAVSYGYRTKEKLQGFRPTHLVETVCDLYALLTKA